MVDPGFTTIGEKTLLTMNTSLPAGGKNVIIAVFLPNGDHSISVQGYYTIKKGPTVLSRTYVNSSINDAVQKAKPVMLLAVDDTPFGNDSYTFTLNITSAGSSTAAVHVQGMVIKTDDAAIAYNSTHVQVDANTTATIVNLNTFYNANSKVVALALAYYYNLSTGAQTINRGNIRLKLGISIISSNEFADGFQHRPWVGFTSLCTLATPTSSPQTWSVEIHNNTGVNMAVFAILVTFTVFDGAFLDTGSVALTGGSQVTVGNLTTFLAGDVAVIGIVAAENTNNTEVIAFNDGDVVLQRDNSTTGQVSNLVRWYLGHILQFVRVGMLPLFRLDMGVSNPTYQIKMTARVSGINGEAKILAFVLYARPTIKQVISEIVWESEGSIFGRRRFRVSAETVRLSELGGMVRNLVRLPLEVVNLIESAIGARIWVRIVGEVENVSETFRGLRDRFRRVLESLDVSETFARLRHLFRLVAENVSLFGAISLARMMVKQVVESVRSFEAIVRSRIITRLTNEMIHIFETFSRFGGKVKAIVETIQLTEFAQFVKGFVVAVVEFIRLPELISKAANFVKILSESLSLSEIFRVMRDRFRSVGEGLHISEVAQHIRGIFGTVVEALQVSEIVTRFKGVFRVVGEALNLEELSRVVRNLFKQISETISIGEAFVRLRLMVRAVLESAIIFEDRLISRFRAMIVSEISNIGEVLVSFGGRVLNIAEVVNILESKMFKRIKTYIRRLVSALSGMVKGGEI
jgi:phage-related holin